MCLTTSFGVTEKQKELENKEANRAKTVSQWCIITLPEEMNAKGKKKSEQGCQKLDLNMD